MPFSEFFRQKSLDHNLGIAAYPMPGATYISLWTAYPELDGSGPEVSGNGYSRVLGVWAPTTTDGLSINPTVITFPTATASWGKITHFGVHSAITGGDFLYLEKLKTPIFINIQQAASFAIGDLKVQHI